MTECGTGQGSPYLTQKGPSHAYAWDGPIWRLLFIEYSQ